MLCNIVHSHLSLLSFSKKYTARVREFFKLCHIQVNSYFDLHVIYHSIDFKLCPVCTVEIHWMLFSAAIPLTSSSPSLSSSKKELNKKTLKTSLKNYAISVSNLSAITKIIVFYISLSKSPYSIVVNVLHMTALITEPYVVSYDNRDYNFLSLNCHKRLLYIAHFSETLYLHSRVWSCGESRL